MNQAESSPAAQLRRVLAIVNPASGSRAGKRVATWLTELALQRGISLVVRKTQANRDPSDLLDDAAQFDRIIVSGGDGTVMQVISGLARRALDTPLAIIPGGTGNVLARAIEVPVDLRQACAYALDVCDSFAMDLGLLDDRLYFALRFSLGYEAHVVRDTTGELKRQFGKLAYAWNGLRHASQLRTLRYTFEVDGERLAYEAESVWVVNTGTLGVMGLELDPDISFADGQLDLCIFRLTLQPEMLNIVQRLLRRKRLPSAVLNRIPVRDYVRITTDAPQPVQVDGDMVGYTPSIVRVVPGAVRLCRARAVA